MIHRCREVLVVEDNPADRRLIESAISECCAGMPVYSVDDGEKAIEYLESQEKSPQAVRTGLILLDLNLPKKSGFEVLDFVKNSDKLDTIPVIVLSTSDSGRDILRAYKQKANCYVIKPAELEKFLDSVRGIGKFWTEIAVRTAQ